MGKQQECPKCVKGAPGWMVTFGDLMSLLLTFFVMLLSFSTMDIVKYKQVAGSLKEALGVVKDANLEDIPKADSIVKKDFSSPSINQDRVINLLRQALRESKLEDRSQIMKDKAGVRLRMEGSVFFASGKAAITDQGKIVLDSLAKVIETMPYKVQVEGHTDDIKVSSGALYASNWELSASRAGSVIRFFIENRSLLPKRFKAVGFADTVPIVPNDTPEHRAKNRRVEFLFTSNKEGESDGTGKDSFSLRDDIDNLFKDKK